MLLIPPPLWGDGAVIRENKRDKTTNKAAVGKTTSLTTYRPRAAVDELQRLQRTGHSDSGGTAKHVYCVL